MKVALINIIWFALLCLSCDSQRPKGDPKVEVPVVKSVSIDSMKVDMTFVISEDKSLCYVVGNANRTSVLLKIKSKEALFEVIDKNLVIEEFSKPSILIYDCSSNPSKQKTLDMLMEILGSRGINNLRLITGENSFVKYLEVKEN